MSTTQPAIKLKRLPGKEPVSRVAFTAEESLTKALDAYCEFYASIYKEEIKVSSIIPGMLKTHLAEDKAFQKFLATRTHVAS